MGMPVLPFKSHPVVGYDGWPLLGDTPLAPGEHRKVGFVFLSGKSVRNPLIPVSEIPKPPLTWTAGVGHKRTPTVYGLPLHKIAIAAIVTGADYYERLTMRLSSERNSYPNISGSQITLRKACTLRLAVAKPITPIPSMQAMT